MDVKSNNGFVSLLAALCNREATVKGHTWLLCFILNHRSFCLRGEGRAVVRNIIADVGGVGERYWRDKEVSILGSLRWQWQVERT